MSHSKISGKNYWNVIISNKGIDPRLFFPQREPIIQKELFRKYVNTINIETDLYCNRACDYCPNSLIDRRTVPRPMDQAKFREIIRQLKSIDFEGRISLNLYNEPLAKKQFVEYLMIARQSLSNARISTNSNGDYLDNDYLKLLAEAGLDDLYVTLHVNPNEKYTDENRIEQLIRFYQRQKSMPKVHRFITGRKIETSYFAHGVQVEVFCTNWSSPELGNSRAQKIVQLNIQGRNWPCVRPFKELAIAFSGDVFPCCQFMPDFESDLKFSAGIVNEEKTIFGIYTNELFCSFRKSLFRFSPKTGVCSSCSERICTTDDRDALIREELAARIKSDTGLELL